MRGRVHDLRGRHLGPATRDRGTPGARLPRGPSRSDPARDADADPRPEHVRDGRATARDGSARLALLQALPARGVRRLRPALGPARGRPLRPCRTAVRADGGRGAADQLPAGRPRGRDDPVAARLHRVAAWRVPEPRASRRREWRFDERIGPAEYAQLALEWREEGAQIIGGCCGTTPEHIAAAAKALEGTKPGRKRPPLPEYAATGGRRRTSPSHHRGSTVTGGWSTRCRSRS